MPNTSVERLTEFRGNDLADLCDAAETAIVDGGGFGWLKPPPREVMERYWKGVLLVPERELMVARLDGVIAGSAQLVKPPRNNEAQAFAASMTTHFVAAWARGHGLAHALVDAVADAARKEGFYFLNLDVRETQETAIRLYEKAGFSLWGTNPNYAMVDGRVIGGRFYSRQLRQAPKRARGQEAARSRGGFASAKAGA